MIFTVLVLFKPFRLFSGNQIVTNGIYLGKIQIQKRPICAKIALFLFLFYYIFVLPPIPKPREPDKTFSLLPFEIVAPEKPKPTGSKSGTKCLAGVAFTSPLPAFPECRPRTRGCCSGAEPCAGRPVCRVFSSIRGMCFRVGCVRLAFARPCPGSVWHRNQS